MKFLHGIALVGLSMLALDKVQTKHLLNEKDLARLSGIKVALQDALLMSSAKKDSKRAAKSVTKKDDDLVQASPKNFYKTFSRGRHGRLIAANASNSSNSSNASNATNASKKSYYKTFSRGRHGLIAANASNASNSSNASNATNASKKSYKSNASKARKASKAKNATKNASKLFEDDVTDLIKITIDKKGAKKLQADQQQIEHAVDRYYLHSKVRYSVNRQAESLVKSKEFKELMKASYEAKRIPFYFRSKFAYQRRRLYYTNKYFNRCVKNVIDSAEFVKPEEAKKTEKFWVRFNNLRFSQCDQQLHYLMKQTKRLANTRRGKDLVQKVIAVKKSPQFLNIEKSLKFQAGTFQHKKLVEALRQFGQDIKTEMKLSELPKNFWKSEFIEKLSDVLEIAEDILQGKITSAVDEMFEDIQD